MSNNAIRLGHSSNSILTLQGLTLEAAIAEADECRCEECGGREGEVVNRSHWEYTSFVVVNGQEYTQFSWEYNYYSLQAHRVQARREWVPLYIRVENLEFHEDGTLMCDYCTGRNFHHCERCGELCEYGRLSCTRCSRGYYCTCGAEVQEQGQTCASCQEEQRRNLIERYSYRPSPCFIGKGPLYLGVELEVLADLKTAARLKQVASYRSYLKSDSSIAGEGFEIVTHPMSLEKQLDFWDEILDEVGKELSPHSSCGMHVHLSREPLSQLQIGKLLVFLNSEENEAWIDWLAGRTANHYCHKEEKSIEDALNPRSRYEALNLMNDKTIEFRLFASSNNLEEICSRIEFCHAVTSYCRECDLEALDWFLFIEWLYISSPKDMYHYLKEWIETTPEPDTPEENTSVDDLPW